MTQTCKFEDQNEEKKILGRKCKSQYSLETYSDKNRITYYKGFFVFKMTIVIVIIE